MANLCLACFNCNMSKSHDLTGIDPVNGQITALFNPHQHIWDEHFEINSDATLKGLTPEGRTTIVVLRINDEQRVKPRQLDMSIGDYPCKKE